MAKMFTEAEVQEMMAPLLAKIAELEAKVAKLEKDSSTSSKPPSSDIVKPPVKPRKKGGKRKRRAGGQPGHERHSRVVFPPEQVDHTWLYEWNGVDENWEPLDEYHVTQQAELAPKLITVSEHRARLYRNRKTGRVLAAPLPRDVRKGGLCGPRLTALVGYQKGACRMSYRVIQRFLSDVMGLSISTGALVKVVGKVSAAMHSCYQQLQQALPTQSVLNVDETGHPECGRSMWTWGFHAPGPHGFTWFHIDPSRGSEVLAEFLGTTFAGVIGCDYYSAYRKFLNETDVVMQFCWAHLIRDVKFLTTLPDKVTSQYGTKLLDRIKQLFRTWHRRSEMTAGRWERAAEQARHDVLQVTRRPPCRSEAQNIAKRFRKHGDYYFTFLDTAAVEPTNNAMERGFRHLVIDRKLTQGTRGENGRRWCERIWTVLATCAQQGRSAFDFIHQTVNDHFSRNPAPYLLTTHG